MFEVELNMWAIIVGIVGAQAIGAIWYSPVLFAKAWLDAVGKSPAELGSPTPALITALVLAVPTAVVMALIVAWSGATSILEGLGVGILVGLGFALAMNATNAAFEGRRLALVAINVGHYTAVFLTQGALFAVWK